MVVRRGRLRFRVPGPLLASSILDFHIMINVYHVTFYNV
jgi:hypothetical protein